MADNHETPEKPLPCNVDAEAALLGSILIHPDALTVVADLIEPTDFYRDSHRVIYQVMQTLHADGTPADLITITDELQRLGRLDDIGGVSAVSSLANQVPTSENADYYARIVRSHARNRALINAAGKIAAVAYNGADDDAACDLALLEIIRVASRGSTRNDARTRSLAAVLDEVGTDVLTRIEQDTAIGLTTSFSALDAHIIGMEPGELIYLAGRPGSGKSALGIKIALMAALKCHADGKGAVDVITLEMSARQQARRLVADHAELNTRFIRAGFRQQGRDPDMDAWATFDEHRMWLQERAGERLYLTDGVVSMSSLRAIVQRAVMERGTRLVVIDQLDLFADGQSKDEFDRITKMSRQLKQIAKGAGVAVLCLVQLSRKCEERRNKRPMLSDLRQSGQLEQDADMVWGLYRPAYYDPQNTDAYFQQFAELLLLKGRDVGSGHMVPLRFEAEYTRFRDWPYDVIPDDPTRNSAE